MTTQPDYTKLLRELTSTFFSSLGLGDLSEEEKTKKLEEITDIIMDRVMLNLTVNMTEV